MTRLLHSVGENAWPLIAKLRRASLLLVLAPLGRAAAEERHGPEEFAEALENTSERIDVVGDRLAQLTERWLEMLPLLVVAVVTIVVFAILAQLLTRGEFLFLWIRNRFVRDLVRHFVRIALIAVGVLIALELLDATALVGAALGAAGVVGIAIGFAFRDIIENYLAGLLLSVRHPFEPNDFVSIDGQEGKIVRLTARATILLTLAGNHLRIPNSSVFKAVLVNYTRNPLRRIDFEMGVRGGGDLAMAQEVGLRALSSMDAILKEPEALCLVERVGDSSVTLHFYAWLDQRETDFFKARSEAIRVVSSAYDDAGIDTRAPIYQVMIPLEEESAVARPLAEEVAVGDTAADATLDEQVESERAAQGPDLLDVDAPRE